MYLARSPIAVRIMVADIGLAPDISATATVIQGDARELKASLASIRSPRFHAVISSPPYPNEHDYTRTMHDWNLHFWSTSLTLSLYAPSSEP